MHQSSDAARPCHQLDVNQNCEALSAEVQFADAIAWGDERISIKVCIQIFLNGSSGCSAMAIMARMIGSERGIAPELAARFVAATSDPISMIDRMSFKVCSFSTACLLSRANDLCET
jgi:hypothetical protein